ncbi:MAG: DUF2155 domain-containing protein [Brevundimonas sp.]|uniref:DUF2155 domain-containing protein n=1 Tax=Brevundimonas sp. TaxID=1871086 RepID=UPI00273278DD|nr:DUF2155 domain-containing protein [Brevundimonas sp.]MDP3404338.1 DUF2155 domain-containing protein [Brevundimonas sp.]
MTRARLLMIGTAAVALAVSGGVVAGGWQDAPAQNATPVAEPVVSPPPQAEGAPTGEPAPAVPIAITPPSEPGAIEMAVVEDGDAAADGLATDEDAGEDEGESETEKAERLADETPAPRQRRRVAIVEAIDKITAESMRFEVEVGGRPVRFNQALIFTARACEVSADAELVQDSIAYLDITLQPKGTQVSAPRQIFRGWMFASTPALSGLQHPIYDAWIVGCKA